jgi:hypothetical protein
MRQGVMLLPAVFLLMCAGPKMPAYMSLITGHAAPDRRGIMQGALNSVRGVSAVSEWRGGAGVATLIRKV